ncbi:hypothetical protein HY995_00680 [Candidatus Micrarchaeota archaeon]|nr:hypothetical protein [Candidatus Micrarchaeota archaeon]
MASLVCKACSATKPAPQCPKCGRGEEKTAELIEKEGKASCGDCGWVQALPNHCGWPMGIA